MGKRCTTRQGTITRRKIVILLKSHPVPLVRTTISGRAALERRTVHVPDVRNYPDYSYGGIDVDPYRTVLAVPMCKAEQVVGVLSSIVTRFAPLPTARSR
jgi:two-component system, NtrC family, sensor kinase